MAAPASARSIGASSIISISTIPSANAPFIIRFIAYVRPYDARVLLMSGRPLLTYSSSGRKKKELLR